jgi:hypothetical protein
MDWTNHGCAQTFHMSQVKTHTCMSVSGQLPCHSLDCKLGGHVVSINIAVSTCICDRKECFFFLQPSIAAASTEAHALRDLGTFGPRLATLNWVTNTILT